MIKFAVLLLSLFLVGCADLQDAMPGMSYSDRTLLKGIKACASYSMDKAISDVQVKKIGDICWEANADNLKDFELILSKLKKEEQIIALKGLLNQAITLSIKTESPVVMGSVDTLVVKEDPDYLMESSSNAISAYYMQNIEFKTTIGKAIQEALDENGAQGIFDELVKLYNEIPYQENGVELILSEELSNCVFVLVSKHMAEHEEELRRNPLLRSTQVLKKTFGDYDPM
ncbi:DUF4197 family protein [Lentisphaera profundi]|uniref:DUF4197 family protein n=1 Tax=Lentisphaera profundi TaxID=1658616 RepID=A0ABY7W0V5_9BACT|nr:DUF4197 family protein [Lentisphaera profundi]WDE99055.1 DUF4197 family protein [Lentisphaera profundi]